MKERIVQLYNRGYSTRGIEKFVDLKKSRINTILREEGVELKGKGNSYKIRKFSINENYFDSIDTEEKAYWLGFLIADGHVSDDGVVLCLKREDKYHIQKFLDAISSNSIIKDCEKTKSSRACVYSMEMVSRLRQIGLLRNKSSTAIYPSISENMHKYLIRGYNRR